ncbi:hypothetical protein pb186bvf_004416 [Paramecium bursaria]
MSIRNTTQQYAFQSPQIQSAISPQGRPAGPFFQNSTAQAIPQRAPVRYASQVTLNTNDVQGLNFNVPNSFYYPKKPNQYVNQAMQLSVVVVTKDEIEAPWRKECQYLQQVISDQQRIINGGSPANLQGSTINSDRDIQKIKQDNIIEQQALRRQIANLEEQLRTSQASSRSQPFVSDSKNLSIEAQYNAYKLDSINKINKLEQLNSNLQKELIKAQQTIVQQESALRMKDYQQQSYKPTESNQIADLKREILAKDKIIQSLNSKLQQKAPVQQEDSQNDQAFREMYIKAHHEKGKLEEEKVLLENQLQSLKKLVAQKTQEEVDRQQRRY